jgi:hypothetical protein
VTVRRSLPLLIAALGIVAIAVAVLARPAAPSEAAPSASVTPEGSAVPAEVVGVIVSVDSASLTEVRGFTLRASDGTETRFRMGVLENGAQFPPGHLVEHQATAEPVRVLFREEDGERVAYRIDDAPRS